MCLLYWLSLATAIVWRWHHDHFQMHIIISDFFRKWIDWAEKQKMKDMQKKKNKLKIQQHQTTTVISLSTITTFRTNDEWNLHIYLVVVVDFKTNNKTHKIVWNENECKWINEMNFFFFTFCTRVRKSEIGEPKVRRSEENEKQFKKSTEEKHLNQNGMCISESLIPDLYCLSVFAFQRYTFFFLLCFFPRWRLFCF